MYCKTSRVDTHDIKLTHSVLFDLVPLDTHDIPFMYYDAYLASFDTHDMKPMQTMCKLLYAVFDLSTLTTWAINTINIKLTHSVLFDLVPLDTHDIPFMYYDAFLASFDTHDMKPMQTMCKLLYAVFDLSTLMTWAINTINIKLTHSVLFDLVPLDTHDIPFMYYYAFLASFDTHDMKPMQTMCKLLYAVFDLSTLTTWAINTINMCK